MKTMKNKTLLAVAVAFLANLTARAEYDPSIGRWASRDPIEELSFRQHYSATLSPRQQFELFQMKPALRVLAAGSS